MVHEVHGVRHGRKQTITQGSLSSGGSHLVDSLWFVEPLAAWEYHKGGRPDEVFPNPNLYLRLSVSSC